MATCASCRASIPAGARFCPACAHPVAEPVALGDERKLATVLFADLVGSTRLADAEDPERTRAMLTRFYDAMADEVVAGGGTVDKFIGDAVMAVFGAPAAQEDHAERALHAALAMRRRLRRSSAAPSRCASASTPARSSWGASARADPSSRATP